MIRLLGDIAEDGVVDFMFFMGGPAGGITLTGTPTVAVFRGNSATLITAGVVLDTDFAGVTGLNHVRIDTSADAAYAAGADCNVVLTNGNIGSFAMDGTTLGHFTIANRAGGKVDANTVLDLLFFTAGSNGAGTTLAGSPAVTVYRDNSTTPITTGVALTTDFAGITGLNHLRIDTSQHASFAIDHYFTAVITAGTVGGVSVVGSPLYSFAMGEAAAGGSGLTATQAAQLAAVYSWVGTGPITSSSPTFDPSELRIVRGDTYTDDAPRPPLSWTVPLTTADLTGAETVTLTVRDQDDAIVFTATGGSVLNEGEATQTVKVPVTANLTELKDASRNYVYDVEIRKSSSPSWVYTVKVGEEQICHLLADQTRP